MPDTNNKQLSDSGQRPVQDAHCLTADEVLRTLGTNASGLSTAQAGQRLSQYGLNLLAEPQRASGLARFLRQFRNLLIYVLLGAAGVTALLQHWVDTMVILAVVIANALIGFIQEGRAEQAMQAIRGMLALRANVLRDGKRQRIDGTQVTPGDIVLLEPGDKVPADLRLLRTHGLFLQEALLTGESVPVEKQTQAVAADCTLAERSCMAYSGTLVTAGQASGVVAAVGADTEIGRVSGLLAGVQNLETPLVHQMGVFAKWLTLLILLSAGLLLLYGYFFTHLPFSEMLMAVVGLSVAAIPEGLPAVLTITLAVGVQAMARCNAIVRRLPAIETMGSIQVICSDKTGTLTRNEMMVASVHTVHGSYQAAGTGYAPEGEIRPGQGQTLHGGEKQLEALARAAMLCNDASLHERQGVWEVQGDPMEGALLAFAAKAGLNAREQNTNWPRTDVIPFDAEHRFMATLHHNHNHSACVFVKGAPERILAMCASQRSAEDTNTALDPDYWHREAQRIASLGQRVLAFAVREIDPGQRVLAFDDLDNSLVMLGLLGMIDPPRPEAIAAVAECYAAGIAVKMITGDHAGTAAAIGKQIGLRNAAQVLTGAELDRFDDRELQARVMDCDIFARTSPEHKLRLVMALQAQGMTVAMTGDGVNDAPALKRADVGVAMGGKGSEAAKEAAELVLADDNFASIVDAVREGRTVYDNLKKVISWTLPTSAGEAITIVVALLFAMTLPVTPVQILWINLITAATLGVALAFEPTEANTMRRPPRARNAPLLNAELAWHIVLVSLLFLAGVFGIYRYAMTQGYSVELARTMAMNTLVMMEIFHLFFIRNIYGTSLTWKAVRGTPIVWLTVLIIALAQSAITYLPPLQSIFTTRSIGLFDGLLIFAIGVALFTIIEVEKQIRLRRL